MFFVLIVLYHEEIGFLDSNFEFGLIAKDPFDLVLGSYKHIFMLLTNTLLQSQSSEYTDCVPHFMACVPRILECSDEVPSSLL